tara:strand:- start:85 stop:348 length:264 start_codon:yes stop_codon:yes gene_type:complete
MLKIEKYPENCPWDFSSHKEKSSKESWTLSNEENIYTFTTSKIDQEYIYVQKNGEERKAFNEYKARFTYQRLFDSGYELDTPKPKYN